MTTKLEPVVLHEATEEGQARPYTQDESKAWVWTAIILGLIWGLPSGVLAGILAALWWKFHLWYSMGIGAAGGYLLVSGAVITHGMWPQFSRLWQTREATTYAPSQPEPPKLESPWRPPFPAHHAGGTTMIDMNERPALPDGRQTGLNLNEPTVAAILREVITKHDGLWSRERLTAIKIGGERVTRKLYEALTPQLCKVGFLQERPRGGFKVADDIELETYFPSLNLSRQAGRQAGRQERGGDGDNPPISRGMNTLAERRKQKFLELGCDVMSYLEWRDNHGS